MSTTFRFDQQPNELRRKEARLCTCGLVQAGYVASWAIQHVKKCPAAALFETQPPEQAFR